MQPIDAAALGSELAALRGRTWHMHLETTAGAYTEGGFGAFIRNARVTVREAGVRGTGPFRAGLATDAGFVYAEGLTHWERDGQGRLLMAGYDGEGRVTVSCEFSAEPWPASASVRRVEVPPPAVPPDGRFLPPTPERAVVSVLAHPDDETFGCGGTLALYARAGVPVTCVCATRGEMGRNMGKPSFATRETLADLRVTELAAACAALGARDLRLLGIWDKTVEFTPVDVAAERVQGILEEVRPSLVLTQHPEFGGHPDHCAIGAATLAAVRRMPAAERPRVRCMVSPRAAERAGLQVHPIDVGDVLEMKLAATRAHRSQSEAMLQRLSAKPEEAEERRRRITTERWADLDP